MKTINPEYILRMNQIVNCSPYFELLSMEIRDVGIGYAVLAIDLAQKHLQPFGIVHGGVLASILDAAAFWSVFYEVEDASAGVTTVDLKLNYLAPATSGQLIAKGRRIKLGQTLGYAEAQVVNDKGQIVAHGTSTLMILPGKAIAAHPPLPPKLIDAD
ncbi:MAG: PaaI family thioesterase [Desulfobacterales bacterium]|nr:MAG: PaaI family thioesterase [Desulfobacterales bacterium]